MIASNFKKFLLDDRILHVLEKIGYKEPTPIQEMAIPKILEGVDVIASAQTGTGKTAAFLLPVLHRFTEPFQRLSKGPRMVVLVPTRELAMQVAAEAKKYSANTPGIKIACIYGGVPYQVQRKALSKNLDILVATPGRLIDLMEQNQADLSQVEFFVLDEADRMLDMGFIGPVEQIAAQMPKNHQTLLFSATIDKKILHLSKKLQKDPVEIRFKVDEATSTQIEQKLYYVDGIKHKMKVLDHILENTDISQAIVFTATKRKADELADHIQASGYKSGALHGDMNQRQRTRTIGRLREGNIQFLVATDVAARGIDISTLSHVINFDLPTQSEDFVHRIGRTGRAGATGIAISFATYAEDSLLKEISSLMKTSMVLETIAGMEPSARKTYAGPLSDRSKKRPSGGGRRESFGKRDREERSDRKNNSRDNFKQYDRPRRDREDRQEKPKPFANRGNRRDDAGFGERRSERERPSFENKRFTKREDSDFGERRREREERSSFEGKRFNKREDIGFGERRREREESSSFEGKRFGKGEKSDFGERRRERKERSSFEAKRFGKREKSGFGARGPRKEQKFEKPLKPKFFRTLSVGE